MIYLDNAATGIKREEILQYIIDNKEAFDGNPDSTHAMGRRAKKILEESREKIAESIGADSKNVIFTAGATESNNSVINAFKDKQIITTAIEHDSILNTIDKSKATILEASKDGIISLEDLENKLTDDIKLVSIMYVNNETGAIQPIKEIGEYLVDKDIHFHVDAVQAYGHIDIDVDEIKCDSLSLSGHKIGGLNGFGILYLRNNIKPFITGGEQEKDRRAGTSFVAGAYSMAASFPKMMSERSYIRELKDHFISKLSKTNLNYEVNGSMDNSSDHVLNIYFIDYKAEFLLTYLDMNGICASAGSACRAGSVLPSHVITNMYDEDRARNSIRFSFGYQNTMDDIDKTIEILERL